MNARGMWYEELLRPKIFKSLAGMW